MSQSKQARLLHCHRFLKRKLRALKLDCYADAEHLLGQDEHDTVHISGRSYKFSFHADVYPPKEEIMVVAHLGKRGLLCGEGYSCGYLATQNGDITYMSQKKLWAFGY